MYVCNKKKRKIEAAHEFERDQKRVDGRSWSSGPQPF